MRTGLLPRVAFAATAACASTSVAAAQDMAVGDAARGRTLHQACLSCHGIDDDDVGPRHRGVVGRQAGAVPDYPYSAALRASRITWDEATLDRWLQNPQRLVPGAKMFFSLGKAQDRRDVIAYLATLR